MILMKMSEYSDETYRSWGSYRILNTCEFPDGYKSKTKRLHINQGQHISYQRHEHRNEVWIILNGEGEVVINDERRYVKRGDVVVINQNELHTIKATTDMVIIEVQHGDVTNECDIKRFDFNW